MATSLTPSSANEHLSCLALAHRFVSSLISTPFVDMAAGKQNMSLLCRQRTMSCVPMASFLWLTKAIQVSDDTSSYSELFEDATFVKYKETCCILNNHQYIVRSYVYHILYPRCVSVATDRFLGGCLNTLIRMYLCLLRISIKSLKPC